MPQGTVPQEATSTGSSEPAVPYPAPATFSPSDLKSHHLEAAAVDPITGECFAFAPTYKQLEKLVENEHNGRAYTVVVVK